MRRIASARPLLVLGALAAFAVAVLGASLYSSGNGPLVCVYFYVWYGSGGHWQGTVDRPVIGFYDSGDPGVVEWQLRLIREAGFDCLIISWWGPGDATDRNAMLVFSRLERYGLKAVIMVEPYLGGDPGLYDGEWWVETVSYIGENYIERYPEAYLRLDGRPLILAFNPIGMAFDPRGVLPNYTIRIVGNDIDNAGYQDWDYWPDYDRGLSGQLRVRRDGYVALAPRYDDEHIRPGGVPPYDPGLEAGWYGRQWRFVIDHRDEVRIVAVATWNEYHERTAIEPHLDPTAAGRDPYLLYRETRGYIRMAGSRLGPLLLLLQENPWLVLAGAAIVGGIVLYAGLSRLLVRARGERLGG